MQTTEKANENITASRVRGTPVYNTQGERIGHVEDLSIDKQTGEIRHALMAFGGFLGMGDKLWALPWALLHYELARGGYVVDVSKDTLKDAPSYDRGELQTYGGERDDRNWDFYGSAGL